MEISKIKIPGVQNPIDIKDTVARADIESIKEDIYITDPHEYVDLGLPSGILWATCNVGATNPEDAGQYFSWGNVQGYYANEPYNFYGVNGDEDGFLDPYASTKGATLLGDNNIPVNSEFDAARFHMGGSWRMPTQTEFQELYDNCTWTWTTKNGVNGYNVASNASGNSNSIFLPAAGCREEESIYNVGSRGNYWSSSFCNDDGPCYSYNLYFHSGNVYPDSDFWRCYGYSVRGVCSSVPTPKPKYDDKMDKTINLTYAQLKDKRDNGLLVPGQSYRITDYITTTVQNGTQSAGHVFDVIVVADDVNKLNEEAHAALHSGDTYFANSKLEAWKIWYCLDNDTDRFAWADSTNGKGVIYRMIDEFNNDVPYDFKNVQYVKKLGFTVLGIYGPAYTTTYERYEANDTTISDTLYYSFKKVSGLMYEYLWTTTTDLTTSMSLYKISEGSASSITETITKVNLSSFNTYTFDANGNDASMSVGSGYVAKNSITFYITGNKQTLNVIYFRDTDSTLSVHDNSFNENCHDMSFNNSCDSNSFGNSCSNNSLGRFCKKNSFSNECNNNSFGNNCDSNSFGNGCSNNSFGGFCSLNSFGSGCSNNSFGNSYTYNLFGNLCQYNSFGNDCAYNSFGNSCGSNSFGNSCTYNLFGNGCSSNSFGNSCSNNSFENRCGNNSFENSCEYNSFSNGCNRNSFGSNCKRNSFEDYCSFNSFGSNYNDNFLGNCCQNISFLKNYTQYVIVENGNQYIDITSTATTSSNNTLRNFTIAQGVNNTTTKKTISHDTVNDTFQTIYQPANSQVISV